MSYSEHISNPKTPQIEKAEKNQVKNFAGGYTFAVDNWTQLKRFLIIGSENGHYYASERKATIDNCDCLNSLLKENGKKVVDTIVEISHEGRAPRNKHALFALAYCSVYGDKETRTYANKRMPEVARFSTDLYRWVDSVVDLKHGKKSKGLQRALGRWYNFKSPYGLSRQICKYPSRAVDIQKWSHRDLIRIFRPGQSRKSLVFKTPSEKHNLLYRYAVHGTDEEKGLDIEQIEKFKNDDDLKYIFAHEKAKRSNKVSEIVKLVQEYDITRESIPNNLFTDKVWEALLPTMPMGALIRNLSSMSKVGLLKPLSESAKIVVAKLNDENLLQRARIHPMNIFLAKKIYDSGSGIRSNWDVSPQISEALEDAFYKSFRYVEPTGKNCYIGIDCSASMGFSCLHNESITSREAAAVVAMAIARKEKNHYIEGFTCNGGLGYFDKSNSFMSDLGITSKDSLDTVVRKMDRDDWGGTDCSLPMLHATKNKLDVDCFIILTDNETWAGKVHPHEALIEYRKKINKNAKLAVLAFESSGFSIADPDDNGMMDFSGIDSSIPILLSDFISGKI